MEIYASKFKTAFHPVYSTYFVLEDLIQFSLEYNMISHSVTYSAQIAVCNAISDMLMKTGLMANELNIDTLRAIFCTL